MAMTKNEQIAALKEQRAILGSKKFRELQTRRACIARLLPLLKFDDTYYASAQHTGDILIQTGFSNEMYVRMTTKLDSIVAQAISELENELTPKPSSLLEEIQMRTNAPSVSLTKFYRLTRFAPGALQECARGLANILGVTESQVLARVSFDHGEGLGQDRTLSTQDLGVILSLEGNIRQIQITVSPDARGYAFILLYDQGGRLCVFISGVDAAVCKMISETFSRTLQLEECPVEGRSTDELKKGQQIPQHEMLPTTKSTESPQSRPDSPRELALPEKVTLAWLGRHAPISLWLWLLGWLAGAFTIGLRAGQIPIVRQFFGP